MKRRNGTKILIILAILSVILLCGFIYYNASSSSRYTLAGDDYIVVVTEKQFEQFGNGQYSNMTLEEYIDHLGLEKIYSGTPEAEREGYLVEEGVVVPPSLPEDASKHHDGQTATSAPDKQ